MVSICMASYNGEKHIVAQLKSIIDQIGTNDEIIISDDGSKDDTLQLIASFNDHRIKVILNSNKPGPVGNFENALVNSKGDIIFLCDQDDIWFNNKIEQHLKMHNDYDLVVSNAVVIGEDKTILFESFFKERASKKGLLANLKRNSYIGCCMSFNRKILKAALPFPSGIHMHDWWIGLVAELRGNVFFLDKQLMYYIRHENNASATLTQKLPFADQLKNRIVMVVSLLKFRIQNKD